jgi:hypothetical protein
MIKTVKPLIEQPSFIKNLEFSSNEPLLPEVTEIPKLAPVSYYTKNINLNPPALKFWEVAKGFPRKASRRK